MNYRKQFKIDFPETVGEKDSAFDNSNYIDWLEKNLDNALKQVKDLTIPVVSKRSEILLAFLTKYIKIRDGEAPSEMDLEILQRFESQF